MVVKLWPGALRLIHGSGMRCPLVFLSMRHAASGFLAGLHAPAAGVCANAAMLMHAGVLVAFVRAKPARRRAGMEHAADHFFVEASTARGEPAGDVTNI